MIRWQASFLVSIVLSAVAFSASSQPQPPSDGALPVAFPVERAAVPQSHVRWAVSPERILVTWIDAKYGVAGVFGSFYDRDGNLIRASFPVSNAWRPALDATPIWNGQEFVVLATHEYLGTFRLRVDDSASVESLGPPMIEIAYPSDVDWNGQHYGVASIYNTGLTLHRLDAAFSLVSSTILDGNVAAADVIAGSGYFLVLSNSWSTVSPRLFLMDRFGTAAMLDLPGAPTLSGARTTAAAWTGNSFLVARMTSDGIMVHRIDPVRAERSELLPRTAAATNLSVTWNGAEALVSWNEGSRASGRYMTADGTVIADFDYPERALAVVPAASGFLLMTPHSTVRLTRTSAPSVVERRSFTNAWSMQTTPSLAGGDSTLLAAWIEAGGVYVNRIRRDGSYVDGAGTRVGEQIGPWEQVDTAFGAGFFVAGWRESGATSVVRFAEGAETITPRWTRLPPGLDIRLAANGERVLVAHSEVYTPEGQLPMKRIHATLIDGDVTRRAATISASTYFDSTIVGVVPLGSGYLVAWNEMLTQYCSRCTRLSVRRLTVLDSGGQVTIDHTLQDVILAVAGRGTDAAVVLQRPDRSIVLRTLHPEGSSGNDIALGLDGATQAGLAALTATPDGYELLTARYSPAGLLYTKSVIRGAAVESAPVAPGTLTVRDAAFAHDRVWYSAEAAWYPMPEAHQGNIPRAFLLTVTPRRRASR